MVMRYGTIGDEGGGGGGAGLPKVSADSFVEEKREIYQGDRCNSRNVAVTGY